MATTVLTPTQRELLKLFAYDHSEEFAVELKKIINNYLQSIIDAESERLWEEGILDQERLDEIRKEDLHATMRNYGSVGA
ncbi:MAG: hypothetical protein K2J82_03820 [Muribaculaceae bacterium]|nr:hypothetical protein [Muribaculaceae bacterium]MDE6753722.1 hypothetical protein [Muribaculaceae bacterium]